MNNQNSKKWTPEIKKFNDGAYAQYPSIEDDKDINAILEEAKNDTEEE